MADEQDERRQVQEEDRVQRQVNELARDSDPSFGVVTRGSFTEKVMHAQEVHRCSM